MQLRQQASKENIQVCAQCPNLEGVLLRMLPNNERLQPTGAKAHSQLCQAWSDYQKPADTRALAAKFLLQDLMRVANIDSELKKFLTIIGLFDE
jgi:hypothetical protein